MLDDLVDPRHTHINAIASYKLEVPHQLGSIARIEFPRRKDFTIICSYIREIATLKKAEERMTNCHLMGGIRKALLSLVSFFLFVIIKGKFNYLFQFRVLYVC